MFLFLTLFLLVASPASDPPRPLLLLNATVHLGDGTTLPNAALAITGDSVSMLADARVIRLDMSAFEVVGLFGNHVYPAERVASSDSLAHLPGAVSVLLDSGQVLVPRRAGSKSFRLQRGQAATLIVTDTLMTENTRPRVLRAFVNGKEVMPPAAPNRCP